MPFCWVRRAQGCGPKPHPPASRVTLSRRRKRGQTLSSEINARETDSSLRRDGSVPVLSRSSSAHVRHSGTQPPPGLEPHQSRRGIGGLREEVWPSPSPASTSSQPRPSQEMACPNRLLPLEDPRQKVRPMCTRGMNFLTWAPSPSGRKSFHRRKSRPMRTRGAHFLAAVRPRGSSLPRTPPRVYTRGGVSVIGPVSRRSDLPSLSENASRVYTRHAFSDAGAPRHPTNLKLRATTITKGDPLAKNGAGNRLPSKPAPPRAADHYSPLPEPFSAGEGYRRGLGAYRGVPTGGKLPICALSRCIDCYDSALTARLLSWFPIRKETAAANSQCEYS